jgi:eukaryotic-like serine/threonine-protein kinase
MKNTACPNLETLTAYVLGKFPEMKLAEIAAHTGECTKCQKALARIDVVLDPLIAALRRPVATGPMVGEPVFSKWLSATETFVGATRTSMPNEQTEWLAALSPPENADEIGRFGGYRVLKVLDNGDIGIVYQAESPRQQRLVALKIMRPKLAADATARAHFLHKARAAAAIAHDHIVAIHDVAEDRGFPYFVMQLLEGEPLDAYVDHRPEGRLPLDEVLRVGAEIAAGLEAAHEGGLIHGDIKPSNIWLEGERRRVKILDFGLAPEPGDDGRLPRALGAPSYVAPERVKLKPLSRQSDLFSLGALLYRLSAGTDPFKRPTAPETLRAVAREQPPPLSHDLPAEFVALVYQLLKKDPQKRPASAAHVRQALRSIRETLAETGAKRKPGAGPASPSVAEPAPHPRLRNRRNAWLFVCGGMAICLLAAGVYWLLERP